MFLLFVFFVLNSWACPSGRALLSKSSPRGFITRGCGLSNSIPHATLRCASVNLI